VNNLLASPQLVERERAIVQVGASNGRPEAVDDHGLAMEQTGLVLVDLDTRTKQLADFRAARLADEVVVDRASEQQHDPHAALRRLRQRACHPIVKNEVRVREGLDDLAGDRLSS
jgi:hypothetical protein